MFELPPLPAGFDPVKEFPISTRWNFFNHAGVAPIAARAAQAVHQYADDAQNDAYLTGKWYKKAEIARKLAAEFIHAQPDEIAFVKNTSEGIAFVANGLTWQAGDEVISTNVEYPSNVYPWIDLSLRFGVKHVIVKERDARIPIEDLFAAVTPRTKMIALSHVEYASGFRHDLAAIGAFCRQHNILLCVDAIQSIGAMPVDVEAMNIDFLSADGHKWMLAPEGCGIFYCNRRHIQTLHPEVGWMNVVNPSNYDQIDFTLQTNAKRFECGSYNIPGLMGMHAALEVLTQIGIDSISQRILALTDLLIKGLEGKGYEVFSPRDPKERSGIVSFISHTHDHTQVMKQLEDKKIIIAVRGGRLRASPHFYQTPEHIQRLINALPDARLA